jgi:hypothetical protein
MARRHTPEDIERALTALVISGNSLRAAEMTGFNDRTIRLWSEKHPDKLARIETKRAPLIDALLVDEYRRTGLQALQVTRQALDKTAQALDEGTLKDPSSAAKNAATVSGIFTDKVAVMEGRPTSIVEHRTADDVLKNLERKRFVDSTAEDLTEEEPQTPFLPEGANANARALAA